MSTLDTQLLTTRQVAAYLGVERTWVYAHANELGAIRLGAGPKARLRFDPDTVVEQLRSPQQRKPVVRRTLRRRTTPAVPLLPIINRRTLG